MKEFYRTIYNFEETKKFIDLLPEPVGAEVFFVSLSARKKYLTEEERKEINLNRAEMFARHIIREKSYEKFYKILRRMETNSEGYTTKDGIPYPTKAIVTYVNINPSDMLAANAEYQRNIGLYTFEMTKALMGGKKYDALLKKLSRLDIEFMNCVQRARGNKKFVDIDFDIDKENEKHIAVARNVLAEFDKNETKYHIVETRGGYHVLLEKKTIGFNYPALVKIADLAVKMDGNYEVIVNKNEMIPLPGTLQGDFEVKIIDKI